MQFNLVSPCIGEVVDIILAAGKAEFFNYLEAGSNGVVNGELGKGLGDSDVADGAGTVAVNTRTLLS